MMLFYGFTIGLATGLIIGNYFIQRQKMFFDKLYTIYQETLGPLKAELAVIKNKIKAYEELRLKDKS